MAGQAGEAEGAELAKAAFEDSGLRGARIEEFDIPGWWRGPCSLTVDPGRSHTFDESREVLELPGTPSGEVSAEVVDVGHGLPDDFADADLDGRIPMASIDTSDDHGRWVHRAEKYGAAAKAGAAGFLFRNHIEGCLPPTGSIGDDDGPGPIPAVGVSKEVGDRWCATAPTARSRRTSRSTVGTGPPGRATSRR